MTSSTTLSHFRRPDCTLRWSWAVLRDMRAVAANLRALLASGISGAVGALLIMVRVFFLNSLVQRYGGSQALVAYSIVSLCQIADSAFVAGACQTMVPLTSMLHGEGDREGIRSTFRMALKIMLSASVIIMVLMEIFAEPLVVLYGMTGAESIATGCAAVRICAFMFPGDALTFLGLYHFIGMGRNTAATSVSVLNGVGFTIPLGLLLPMALGLTGVWVALPLAQWAAVAYTAVVGILLRRREQHEGNARVRELAAFSLNDTPWTEEMETQVHTLLHGDVNHAGNRLEARLACASACLRALDAAPLAAHHKHRDTDVRICEDAIIIKNEGVNVDESAFEGTACKGATFSRVMGFNLINC